MLINVERWLLFGVSQYRRAFDMFTPSSAHWAQVTLYYASFFAANAILGMFGGWVHLEHWADIELGTVNHQVLHVHRKLSSPSGYRGSHQIFWDVFYEASASYSAWVPAELVGAITPVTGNRVWQISSRNEVNYDMAFAFDAALLMDSVTHPKRLDEYGGTLGQQREVTESTLRLALYFANEFGVSSYPFEGLFTGVRSRALRTLVTRPVPGLVTQSALQQMFL